MDGKQFKKFLKLTEGKLKKRDGSLMETVELYGGMPESEAKRTGLGRLAMALRPTFTVGVGGQDERGHEGTLPEDTVDEARDENGLTHKGTLAHIKGLGMHVSHDGTEYRIAHHKDDEDGAYYTDDRRDAIMTAETMRKHRLGEGVEEGKATDGNCKYCSDQPATYELTHTPASDATPYKTKSCKKCMGQVKFLSAKKLGEGITEGDSLTPAWGQSDKDILRNGYKFNCHSCGKSEKFQHSSFNEAHAKAVSTGWTGNGSKNACPSCSSKNEGRSPDGKPITPYAGSWASEMDAYHKAKGETPKCGFCTSDATGFEKSGHRGRLVPTCDNCAKPTRSTDEGWSNSISQTAGAKLRGGSYEVLGRHFHEKELHFAKHFAQRAADTDLRTVVITHHPSDGDPYTHSSVSPSKKAKSKKKNEAVETPMDGRPLTQDELLQAAKRAEEAVAEPKPDHGETAMGTQDPMGKDEPVHDQDRSVAYQDAMVKPADRRGYYGTLADLKLVATFKESLINAYLESGLSIEEAREEFTLNLVKGGYTLAEANDILEGKYDSLEVTAEIREAMVSWLNEAVRRRVRSNAARISRSFHESDDDDDDDDDTPYDGGDDTDDSDDEDSESADKDGDEKCDNCGGPTMKHCVTPGHNHMAVEERAETMAQMRDRLVASGRQASRKMTDGMPKIHGVTPEQFHSNLKAAADHYYSLPHEERHKLYKESVALRGGKGMLSGINDNPKTAKSTPGHVTTIFHLPAHKESGLNTCQYETKCAAGCISQTGNPSMADGKKHGRADRLHHMVHNPLHAIAHIDHEIHAQKSQAKREGKKLGVRLNGTSDIPWHKIAPKMFSEHHDVQFYDYTKSYHTIQNHHEIPKNYDITFSSTGINHPDSNWHHAKQWLDKGGKVAMTFARAPKIVRNGQVVGGHKLPTHVHDEESGHTYQVHNGDDYDGRFMDHHISGTQKGKGLIVGLSYKKSKKFSWKNAGMFAVRPDGAPRPAVDHAAKMTHAVAKEGERLRKHKEAVKLHPEHEIVHVKKGMNPKNFAAKDAPKNESADYTQSPAAGKLRQTVKPSDRMAKKGIAKKHFASLKKSADSMRESYGSQIGLDGEPLVKPKSVTCSGCGDQVAYRDSVVDAKGGDSCKSCDRTNRKQAADSTPKQTKFSWAAKAKN